MKSKVIFMNFKEFVFGFIFTFVARIVRLFPNNDPIMGVMLPSARKNGLHAAVFAFTTMFVFDYFTSGIGVWTYVTASTYALLALSFSFYFSKRKVHYSTYASSAIVGVIIFDIITGPGLSTFIFHQSLWFTTLAQIPFTISHLFSGLAYTLLLAPVLDLDVRKELVEKAVSLKNHLILLSKSWRGFL
jgi:hypothetical protein